MKRHPVDPLALVFGALFALMGVTFLVSDVSLSQWHADWVGPVGIIALGALLVALAPRSRTDKPVDPVGEDPPIAS
ncbi:MAG: hypothetical protein QOF16_1211 [Actinomycetota bacterium]|jgi:hypothetical protein|nr:hypothetical protein [Actinomycetota bacterium]MEA2487557.1 hypothetical protein [Actinomycetota bacterium]